MNKTDKFLKHTKNGRIYPYNKNIANDSDVVVITAEEAYPEKFLTPKQKTRKRKLSLETEDFVEPEVQVNEQLGLDASRDLP